MLNICRNSDKHWTKVSDLDAENFSNEARKVHKNQKRTTEYVENPGNPKYGAGMH
jgi:hypothetical protein